MDIRRVIDQTVREIKREVNIKLLKVPEIEQKVLDATSDEPWGPHGSDLAVIAQATKKFSDCYMIMNVLWMRLSATGRNWRHVYKALAVIEYLVANGSERAVDDILEHTYQISSLSGFEYVEPSGKDMGLNVRKRSEAILALLSDKDKIDEVRNKAAANHDKYFGLSSTGITYKSSSTSYGSTGSLQGVGYSGFCNSKEIAYSERGQNGDTGGWSPDIAHSERVATSEMGGSISMKESDDHISTSHISGSVLTSDYDCGHTPSQSSRAHNNEDDLDDFDPRGSSIMGSGGSGKQVDSFGGNLIDVMDGPDPVLTDMSAAASNRKFSTEVDLFADAVFVSATPASSECVPSHLQDNVDLFAQQHASSTISSTDLFDNLSQSAPSEIKAFSSEQTKHSILGPPAGIPLPSLHEVDSFDDFVSNSDASQTSGSDGPQKPDQYFVSTRQIPKDNFKVKSGIWADSLSRGLIDLNISASKKISLADIGIVGLDDGSNEKGSDALYIRKSVGRGPGMGRSSLASMVTRPGT